MEDEENKNIDQISLKYKYNDSDILENDDILRNLSAECYIDLDYLEDKIDELLDNLKQYNGNKKKEVQKYIIQMNELSNYCKSSKKDIMKNDIYYSKVICNIQDNYKQYSTCYNMEQTCKKAIKEILDLKIKEFIKYDKIIINNYDLIKNINKDLNF